MVNGIGPETADSILCYALHAPWFVVDAYTIRFLQRLEGAPALSYETIQALVHAEYEEAFPRRAERARRYNELHALIVRLGYGHCTKSRPACGECPLQQICRFGRENSSQDHEAKKD